MAGLLGSLVGGFLLILLLSIALENILFARIFDDPVRGKLTSAFAAWVIAAGIAGWGFANGGPYRWDMALIYLLPALLVAFLGYRRGIAIREEMNGPAEI